MVTASCGSAGPASGRALLRLLHGLALALLALHLGAGWVLAGSGAAGALGSADAGLLGLLAPAQLAGLGVAAWLAAARTGDEGVACAAVAAVGLAVADAASLPAGIAGLLPAGLGGLLPGVPARRAAKLLAGAVVVLPVAGLLLAAAARSPDGRRLARILVELVLGFGAVALVLDLPSAGLPRFHALLDGVEEAAEAALAGRALVVGLTALGPRRETSRNRTIARLMPAVRPTLG